MTDIEPVVVPRRRARAIARALNLFTVPPRGTKIISEQKRKSDQDHADREKAERDRREKVLDEALEDTFPASDPVSVEQPAAREPRRQIQGH